MDKVINVDFSRSNVAHASSGGSSSLNRNIVIPVHDNTCHGLIDLPKENIVRESAPNHTSEPIKDIDTINRISEYLISNRMFRDNMLFIVGINFGLRISDMLTLRFCDIIDDNFAFKRSFDLIETKTRNTRAKIRNRCIFINSAVTDAVVLFLKNSYDVSLSDYMFRANSSNTKFSTKPMSRQAVDNMLKKINRELNLGLHFSSHTLRKTFAYHQMAMSNHDPRKLVLLQKMFGHSSIVQTLDYIGLTKEEMEDAYMNLNLGSDAHYRTYCQLASSTSAM